MTIQKVNAIAFFVCVAFAMLVFAFYEPKARPKPRPRSSVLAAVPSGASFAASADVTALRKSEVGQALLAAGRELPGVGRLDAICGFDPSEQVRQVAIALSGDDLGIVVAGNFDKERIARCAEAVVLKRGGEPARSPLSSFVTIRDRAGTRGEVAARSGGPVLLGEGRYLRDMIDALEGRSPNLRRDELHASLRSRLGDGAAVVATWKLQPGWLERVSGEPLAAHSPLSAVRAAALRLDITPELSAQALLVCATAAQCDEVSAVVTDLSRDFGPTLREELGTDPLEGARIDRVASAVRIRVTLDDARATTIVRRLALRLIASPPEPEPPPPPPPPP